jgi:hypothetical protein
MRKQQSDQSIGELWRQKEATTRDIRVMAHEITEYEAFRERLTDEKTRQKGKPLNDAEQAAVNSAANAEENKRRGTVIAGELTQRETPTQKYERFKKDLEAAVSTEDKVLVAEAKRRGYLTKKGQGDARRMADEMEAQKALELAPERQHGGRFTDAESYWKEIQGQINKTDYPKATLEEVKRMTASNDAMRAILEHWKTQGVIR